MPMGVTAAATTMSSTMAVGVQPLCSTPASRQASLRLQRRQQRHSFFRDCAVGVNSVGHVTCSREARRALIRLLLPSSNKLSATQCNHLPSLVSRSRSHSLVKVQSRGSRIDEVSAEFPAQSERMLGSDKVPLDKVKLLPPMCATTWRSLLAAGTTLLWEVEARAEPQEITGAEVLTNDFITVLFAAASALLVILTVGVAYLTYVDFNEKRAAKEDGKASAAAGIASPSKSKSKSKSGKNSEEKEGELAGPKGFGSSSSSSSSKSSKD